MRVMHVCIEILLSLSLSLSLCHISDAPPAGLHVRADEECRALACGCISMVVGAVQSTCDGWWNTRNGWRLFTEHLRLLLALYGALVRLQQQQLVIWVFVPGDLAWLMVLDGGVFIHAMHDKGGILGMWCVDTL